MDTLSRRTTLQMFGGFAGAAAVSAAAGIGMPAPTFATDARSASTRTLRRLGPKPVFKSGTTLIGMSAPAGVWDARVAAVGAGLGARRIFADLAAGPTSQIKLVEQAHADGMLPVISYKVGGDAAGAAAGRYNDAAEQAAAKLASYDLPPPSPSGTSRTATSPGRSMPPSASRSCRSSGAAGSRSARSSTAGCSTTSSPPSRRTAPMSCSTLWDWFGIDTYESGHDRVARRLQARRPHPRAQEVPEGARARRDADRGGRVQRLQRRVHRRHGEALFTTPERVVRLPVELHRRQGVGGDR